jgi:hypothetical protein
MLQYMSNINFVPISQNGAPMMSEVRSRMRSDVLFEVHCYNCLPHIASSRVQRIFINDCNKLEMATLEWPWVAYCSFRVSLKSDKCVEICA